MSQSNIKWQTDTIRMPRQVDWVPQQDITAYELALAMPAIATLIMHPQHGEDVVASLPEGAKRHFRVR